MKFHRISVAILNDVIWSKRIRTWMNDKQKKSKPVFLFVFVTDNPDNRYDYDTLSSLQWSHNEHDGISNHWCLDCLLNRLFRHRSKKNIKALRRWPLLGEFTGWGNSPATSEFTHEGPVMWKMFSFDDVITLQWRYNDHDGVSNHQPHGCFCSIVYSGADQRKHQSSASLALVRGIHQDRWIPRSKGQ